MRNGPSTPPATELRRSTLVSTPVYGGAMVTMDVRKEGTKAEMNAKQPHMAAIAIAGCVQSTSDAVTRQVAEPRQPVLRVTRYA